MHARILVLIVVFLSTGCQSPTMDKVGLTSSIEKKALAVNGMPAPIGPYSPIIESGDFLFLSGQIGKSQDTGELVSGGIQAETRQVMENIKSLLTAGDASFSDVVQAQVYLLDINDYAAMNEVYATYFDGLIPPARAAVAVAALPGGASVEIMMTARR